MPNTSSNVTRMKPAVRTSPTLQEKFGAFQKALRERLFERNDDIYIFTLALLTRQHAFFLGEPGIAKSMMVDLGMEMIDGLAPEDYVKILFMKGTVPQEVFGPLNLDLLKKGRWVYNTEGYLPSAKFFFGDEIWKGNSAVQNANLMIMNEREFRNDGRIMTVPLHSGIFCSNEMPEDEKALAAIYDRMLFRKTTNRISEPGNFIGMLEASVGPRTKPGKVLSVTDIESAADLVATVAIPRGVLDALNEVRQKLKKMEIFPSDRRFAQALKAVQAAAWLDGEDEADIEHLRCLEHVLWDRAAQHQQVRELLYNMANPIDKNIREVMDTVSSISDELEVAIADQPDSEQRMRIGAEIYKKLVRSKKELKVYAIEQATSRKRSALLADASQQIMTVTERMLLKMLEADPETIDINKMAIFDEAGNVLPDEESE